MKKTPLILLLASFLALSGCNNNTSNTTSYSDTSSLPSTDISDVTSNESSEGSTEKSGEDSDTSKDSETVVKDEFLEKFNEIKNNVKTKHNYTLDVYSAYEGDDEDPYEDSYVNINDLAYYNRFYNGYSGIILQKDQGYIKYVQSGNNILYNGFYATNYNVGISSIYDLCAENLFLGDYSQDQNDKSLFYSSDKDSIAVASNFTGYVESSWFVAPEKLEVKVDLSKSQLVFNVNFELYAIVEGEETTFKGICTLTLKNIGSSSNSVVENYIKNPTNTFTARSNWTPSDKVYFDTYYFEEYPPFIPNASYTFDIDTEETYNGTDIYVTDYKCGDVISNYGVLLESDGYTKISDTNYRKVIDNEETKKRTTFNVEMAYKAPSEDYYGRTIGTFYPNGVFQIKYSARSTNIEVTSISQLNAYLTANGLDRFVPIFSWGDEVTEIRNFSDRTENMTQLYGDNYLFYTSTDFIRIYISDYNVAKIDVNKYTAALEEYTYTNIEVSPFGYINYSTSYETTANADSYISITNLDALDSSTYRGYIQIRFNIYKFSTWAGIDNSKEDTNSYAITYHTLDENYDFIDVYGVDFANSILPSSAKEGETVNINIVALSGYTYLGYMFNDQYDDMDTQMGEDNDWTASSFTFTMPSHEVDIIISTSLEEVTEYIVDKASVEGATIVLISHSPKDVVEEGETVRFSVSVSEGYNLEKVYIEEDPNIEINSSTNPISGATSYSFIMPNHNATITVKVNKNSSGDDEEVTLNGTYEYAPSNTSIKYYLEFNDDGTGRYYKKLSSGTIDKSTVISYEIEDNRFSLTYVSGSENSDYANNFRPFEDSDTKTNSTGIIVDANTVTMVLYNTSSGASSTCTFTLVE